MITTPDSSQKNRKNSDINTESAVPEYHSHEEFQNRSRKLKEIRELGVEPYPAKFSPQHKASFLKEKHDETEIGHSEDAAAGTTDFVCLAGRLVLFRAMGKNAFGQIQDDTGRIQVMFNRDITKVEGYDQENTPLTQPPSHIKFIEKKIDIGDIIGVEGHLFHTNKGELTIFVKKLTILCKTLLPLPDKHAGLADKEVRYRKRWLDLIGNPEVKETFVARSRIMKFVRRYCEDQSFMEVETPVLQNIYGGAAARPFTTEFHALDQQEVFLRISLEIKLKKLLVGGLSRVFEIGKVFRNEGIDRNHNPEFSLLEAYAAYWDYNDMMVFVENLFEKLALELFGTTEVPYGKEGAEGYRTINMKAPWPRLTMKDSIRKFTGIDVDILSDDEIREKLKETGRIDEKKIASAPRGILMFNLFEERVEHFLQDPHHITDHPIETTPLCKGHRDPIERENGIVERFESFIMGQEICNAYSELNDPEVQRELLVKQSDQKDAGDVEANPLDEEFIEAICQGMPPAGGIGIGMDRLIMLFTNSSSIRDVLYFPFMKNQDSPQNT
ncbi:MAG: lysyl-tRNA synthetase class 2 [Chlamydiales bacterium]|jgi:lysyl-tRNA synthetase class 2